MQKNQRAFVALVGITALCAKPTLSAAPDPDRNFYIGAGAGGSYLQPLENNSGWRVTDRSDQAYKLFLGYQFNERWFAELDYTDLGKAQVAPNNQALSDPQGIDYKSPSISAGYYLRKSKHQWNIFLRAGMAAINNDDSGNLDIFEKKTSAQFMVGAGLERQLKNNLFLRVEVTNLADDATTYMASLGYQLDAKKHKAEPAPQTKTLPPPPERPQPQVQPKALAMTELAEKHLNIYFVFASNEVRVTYYSQLRALADYLKTYPEARVLIQGHTDQIGDNESNQALSLSRATAVMEFLTAHGAQPSQCIVEAYGESRRISFGVSNFSRGKNRRVEIQVFVPKGEK